MKVGKLILVLAVFCLSAGMAVIAYIYGLGVKDPELVQAPPSAPPAVVELPAPTEPPAPAEQPVVAWQGESIEAAQPTPEPAAYALKLENGALALYYEQQVVLTLPQPEYLPGEVEQALAAGMAFHTLEEVESWLESLDS